MGDEKVIMQQINMLAAEHRSIDIIIEELEAAGTDVLRIRKLKKRKLAIRDQIAILESMLHPNLIA
jgi:hypothetical protein